MWNCKNQDAKQRIIYTTTYVIRYVIHNQSLQHCFKHVGTSKRMSDTLQDYYY